MTGAHRRILVVEDDPETAGQLVEELTTSGYDVDLAANGREALSQGAARDYAVITIDRMLPDIDGLDVCRRIRTLPSAAAQVPVLMLTAKGDEVDRIVGLEIGADDYLPKPFNPRELVARIGAVLAAPENRQDGNRIVIAGRDGLQDSVNQVGQEMTRRNMNIQPTLTERPGLPVRIIANRDLVLRPYQPMFFNRGAMR